MQITGECALSMVPQPDMHSRLSLSAALIGIIIIIIILSLRKHLAFTVFVIILFRIIHTK